MVDRTQVRSGCAIDILRALRRGRDYMDRCFAEPLDMRTVAAKAGYSQYHFVRAFRSAYGEPPGRYLCRRRIERAQELLRSVNLTVTEVCHEVGFTSLGSFSSRFTELTGVSPSQYRRRFLSGPPPIPACFLLMRRASSSPSVSGAPELPTVTHTAKVEKPSWVGGS